MRVTRLCRKFKGWGWFDVRCPLRTPLSVPIVGGVDFGHRYASGGRMRCGVCYAVLRPKATSIEEQNLTVRRTVLLHCLRQAEGGKTLLRSRRHLGAAPSHSCRKRKLTFRTHVILQGSDRPP